MLQAAFLLLEKLTAKSLSRPIGPQKAPVDRQCDSTRGREGVFGPHTISSLCLQEHQCVNLNEELISNEGEA